MDRKINRYRKKDVAIVVPIYKKNLNPEEKISAEQLKKKLQGYTFFLVLPKKLFSWQFADFKEFKKIPFKDEFFEGYDGYNRLLKDKIFYSSFKKFKYILIYQTDCLVFKDNLLDFCNKNYDYVGAPIFQYNPKGKMTRGFVGNGGLSLRKVNSFLKVLENRESFFRRFKWIISHLLLLPIKTFQWFFVKKPRSISHLFTKNEDIFWSCEAKKFYPLFRKAPLEDACRFSIEREIEYCMQLNKQELPFGCHAFQRYDKKFWNKFI